MNDLTRQVAGALGVAVIGSITTTLYGNRMEDATAGLPHGAAEAAQDTVGGAVAVADKIPGHAGTSLADRAADAFTDSMALGFVGAAAVAFVGWALVMKFLPARHAPARREHVVTIARRPAAAPAAA
jgi:DHA2 family multidrug resistance protein-like MFS transporter